MQFDVLGPLRVIGANGRQVTMTSVAQRRLMSILVCRVGVVVSADSLAEHLELSSGALRTSVSRLRRIVGFDVLVTEPPGYELRSDNVDAQRFEQLLDAARAAPDATAARAARLVTAARRRHPANVPSPFLLAFAWLAVEEGDLTRAADLAGVAELYDASTLVALLHLLAAIHDWSDEDWPRERDAANAAYLSAEHETAAKQGYPVLTAEIDRWTLRLSRRRTLERA